MSEAAGEPGLSSEPAVPYGPDPQPWPGQGEAAGEPGLSSEPAVPYGPDPQPWPVA